jgi:glutathione S-transferase
MILFYSPGTCAFAEMVLMQWTGEPHRLCRLSRDERRGDVYRKAVNPHGQVPALWHEGRVLTENAAILALLADRHPKLRLIPEPKTPERYELYRWLSWLDSGFHMAHAPMFAPQRFAPDPATHEAVKAYALVGIREQLGVLERHLQDRRHVLLDRKNLLDCYVFAMARWCEEKLDYRKTFPAVKRFLDRMREDEGVRAGLRIEAGELRGGEDPKAPLRGHVDLADLLDRDGRLDAARLG